MNSGLSNVSERSAISMKKKSINQSIKDENQCLTCDHVNHFQWSIIVDNSILIDSTVWRAWSQIFQFQWKCKDVVVHLVKTHKSINCKRRSKIALERAKFSFVCVTNGTDRLFANRVDFALFFICVRIKTPTAQHSRQKWRQIQKVRQNNLRQ